ncbi:hypothetical protein PFISCL1PPCAC_20258, partial [Pristionchus fissidentatus]
LLAYVHFLLSQHQSYVGYFGRRKKVESKLLSVSFPSLSNDSNTSFDDENIVLEESLGIIECCTHSQKRSISPRRCDRMIELPRKVKRYRLIDVLLIDYSNHSLSHFLNSEFVDMSQQPKTPKYSVPLLAMHSRTHIR